MNQFFGVHGELLEEYLSETQDHRHGHIQGENLVQERTELSNKIQ